MLTLSTMGKRISTAALLLFLGLAPAAANADVTVAEPTGDADPAVTVADGKSATGESSPLPTNYDRERALRMSVMPTIFVTLAGEAIFSLGFVTLYYSSPEAFVACNVVGSVLMGSGLIFGPSIGYFWIGRTGHAVGMSALRLLTFAASMGTMVGYVTGVLLSDSDPCFNEDGGESRCVHPALLATSIVAFAATMVLAYVDAGLVGRAADHANEQWRDKNKPTVTVAPVAWSNGNGDGTFGLAVSGTF